MIEFSLKYCLYIHKGKLHFNQYFDKMEFFYLLLNKDRRIFFNQSLF